VSWNPKPDAIAALAGEFNLGLDSFVFVDDSPYEIGAVASQLPTVRTLQVPDDIEALPDLLAESGWFRGMRVTSDDRERTARIQAEQQRTSESTTMSHEQFLASLGLRLHAFDVGAADLGRATQLINKTNQFNLTTIRRSEAEVAELVSDPDSLVLGFAVDDRFGEYGLIGVAIGRRSPAGWLLDTFLMSCRVLGRGVETGMLASTVDRMRSTAAGPVGAHYVATPKNAIVADLLTRHGFETIMADRCELPSDRSIAIPSHLTIVSP
jgi:FkbH-like protein